MTLAEEVEELRRRRAKQKGLAVEEPEPDLTKSIDPTSADAPVSVKGTAKYIAKDAVPSLVRGIVGTAWGLAKFGAKFLAAPVIGTEPAMKQAKVGGDMARAYAYDRWQNPVNAIPDVTMLAGGAIGGLLGIPGVGAIIGTGLGIGIKNDIKNKPWTNKDVGDVGMAPLANAPVRVGSAMVKQGIGIGGTLRTKGTAIYNSIRLSPEQIAIAEGVRDKADIISTAKREALQRLDPAAVALRQSTGENIFPFSTAISPKGEASPLSPRDFEAQRQAAKQGPPQKPVKPLKPLTEKRGNETLEQRMARAISDAKARTVYNERDRMPARAGVTVAHDSSKYNETMVTQPVEEHFPKRNPVVDYLGYDVDPDLYAKLTRPQPAKEAAPDYLGYDVAKSLPTETLPTGTLKQEHVGIARERNVSLPDLYTGTRGPDRALAMKEYGVDDPGPTLSQLTGLDEAGTALEKTHQAQRRGKFTHEVDPSLPPGEYEKLRAHRRGLQEEHLKEKKPYLFSEGERIPIPDTKRLRLENTAKIAQREAELAAARQTLDASIAEEAARLQGQSVLDSNVLLRELEEDATRLANIRSLTPDQLSPRTDPMEAHHLAPARILTSESQRPSNNPFIKAFHKANISASLANPHLNLAYRMGNAGYMVSQLYMEANDLHVTAVEKFRQLAHGVYDRHNIQEGDLHSHGLLHTLFEHPELADNLKRVGTEIEPGKKYNTADAVSDFERLTGERINVTTKDLERLREMSQFTEELRNEVYNPMWAFMLKQGVDPDDIAEYNMRYIMPTFTSRRYAVDIKHDLKRIEKAYNALDPDERMQEHGLMLENQYKALQTKLDIATKAADEADMSRSRASQTLYKQGQKPGEIFSSAYKDKHTEMMFGTGMRSSMDDYISSFLKKAIYDPVNAKANEVIKTAPWDPSSKRWVTSYALDQMNTRRAIQTQRLAQWIQRIPGLEKVAQPDAIERAVNTIGQYNAAVNMGLNPRFYPVNATQSLVMGYGLVGADGLAHGLTQVVTNWSAAYKRALNNGAVQSGLEHMWEEKGTNSRGHVITRFKDSVLGNVNKMLVASEAFNRTLMNEAGLYVAQKEGLKGRDAVRRARDINRMANYGYSSAERVTASNTLLGSTVLRYKSFGLQSVSNIAHLMKHDKKAAAETIAMVIALSGTSGMPGFGMVQDQLAKHLNYNLPNLMPIDEVTGTNLSASFSPWPHIPGLTQPLTLENLVGPLLGPPAAGIAGVHEGDESKVGRAMSGLIGAGPSHLIKGIDEYRRGGVTTTNSGRTLIKRPPEKSILYGLNLADSPKGEAWKYKQDIERAHKTGDSTGLAAAKRRAVKGGMPHSQVQGTVSTARREETMEKKRKTALDIFMGR